MTEREAYRILGRSPGADGAELKRTYRRLMMQAHPDAGKNAVPDRARELNLAYAVLKGSAAPGKKAPSRASAERDPDPQKKGGWDAPLNPNAYAGREILCYAEDQDGAPLGSFPIAKGKYLWRVEEDFPLFLLSIYRCSREILDEADAALNRVSPPSREGIHAQLAYLLAQQFIDGTALLPRLAKKCPPDRSGEPVFCLSAMLEPSGAPAVFSEGEPLYPSALRRHRLYVKQKSGKEAGYLSFPDDRLYYVVVPLLEQRRVRIRIQAASDPAGPKNRGRNRGQRLNVWLKWADGRNALPPENLNLQIEELLALYRDTPRAPREPF